MANFYGTYGDGSVGGGTGDVVGPSSAVNNDVAVFDGVTGKLIKDGGQTIAQIIAAATPTTGNLTDAGTDGIVVTGGTGAVVGSGTSLAQHVADATHNGYLASADFVTFAAKQAAGNYITALTGDVTAAGPGSVAAAVALVGGSTAANVNTATIAANAATDANTASTIVKRDGSGNFTAGTITAALTGNATTATTAGNVSGTVAISHGGTNSTAALNNNRVMQSSGGGIVEASAITASRALASDANGIPVAATTTTTELNFVNGVTSAIQTQINTKFTTANVAQGAAGLVSGAGQLLGTNTNDAATAGNVGQVISSIVSTFTNSSVSAQFENITSISLTAGNWLVHAQVNAQSNGSVFTDDSQIAVSINSGNTTTDQVDSDNQIYIVQPSAASRSAATIAGYPQSLSGTTTVFLKIKMTYSSGTPKWNGRIRAVRIR